MERKILLHYFAENAHPCHACCGQGVEMSFDQSRRQCLLAALACSGGLVHAAVDAPMAVDDLLGGGRYQAAKDGPFRYTISRVSPLTGSVRLIDVPFFPHGLAVDPLNRQRIYAFEKVGPGAAVIDLATMRWQSTIAPAKKRRFYGHAVCSPDGEFLYSTETDNQGVGAIGVREASSLRYVGDFPSYGANPHDCALIEDGQVMVITNGGGNAASEDTPCVSYVDVRTRRLLHKSDMPDRRFNTGHLFMLPGRESVVVSAPRLGLGVEHPGAISRQKAGQNLSVIDKPQAVTEALLGEALSVLALPAQDLLMVTHPTPGLVTLWRLGSGEHVKSLALPHARGLVQSQDGQTVWISFGTAASLCALSLRTFELVPEQVMVNTLLAGSHLYNHGLMQ